MTGLGVRLVIVVGHQQQTDERLLQLGLQPHFVGGYRVTDAAALKAAVESAGLTRMEVGLPERPPSAMTTPLAIRTQR